MALNECRPRAQREFRRVEEGNNILATGRYKRNSRRRKSTRAGRLVLCVFIEILAVTALILMIGWNRGIGDWMRKVTRPTVKELDISGICSPNAVLMQAKGGKILGEINSEEQIYPASMTKMMTVLVAIEELKDLNQEILLTDEIFVGLVEEDATQAGFQSGERVTVRDLLYGAMLPSGAECCRALADAAGGSKEGFVGLMNKKAEKLGMENTQFRDTTGLHDSEHYSSVKDMAILLKAGLRNDIFREVITSPAHSTAVTNLHPEGITFYSTMFKGMGDTGVTGGEILGGKTGFTSQAGHCLASFAEIDGREYILVTAGAQGETEHFQDAGTIYNRLGEAALALEEKTE